MVVYHGVYDAQAWWHLDDLNNVGHKKAGTDKLLRLFNVVALKSATQSLADAYRDSSTAFKVAEGRIALETSSAFGW